MVKSTFKENTCYAVAIEHFSGHVVEVIAVFDDLEEAKAFQKTYDSMNRISVTIYRTTHFTKKTRRKKDV